MKRLLTNKPKLRKLKKRPSLFKRIGLWWSKSFETRGRKRRFLKPGTQKLVYVLLALLAFIVVSSKYARLDAEDRIKPLINKAYAQADIEASKSAQLEEVNKLQAEELEAIKAKHPNPTQGEIEAYVKLIFGSDAKVAIAISHHECGTWDKSYPKCHLKTSAENSIGLFQINLYNSKQWIHAGRIPGTTMAEKEQWLENPFNNTIYAYWVFKTSGWNPWSTYKSGAYLKDM